MTNFHYKITFCKKSTRFENTMYYMNDKILKMSFDKSLDDAEAVADFFYEKCLNIYAGDKMIYNLAEYIIDEVKDYAYEDKYKNTYIYI